MLLTAAYLTLLGGSPYYLTVFPVRVLHHIVMTALLAGWLIQRIHSGKGLPRTPLDLWLAAAVGVYTVTTLFSRDPRVSLEVLWFPLQFILIFYMLAALITAGRVRLLLEAQLLMAAVVVIAALMQLASWWLGLNLVPDTALGWNAALRQGILPLESPLLFLPLGVTTWLAAYTAPLVLFAGVKALTERQRDLRAGLLLLAALLLIVMLLTGSRGGMISLGAGGALLLLLRIAGSGRFRRLPRPQQVMFVLLPALIFAAAGAGALIWSQIRGSEGSDMLRLGLWRGAVTIIRDHPLTGVGPGMFGRVYREVREPYYVDDRLSTAHNILLNTAAETGIGGVLILIGIGVSVTRVWWHRWRAAQGVDRLRLEGAYAALIGLVVQSQFDLFTATPIVLLMILLTAYICIEPVGALPARRSRLAQGAAAAALIGVIGFGVLLLHWDRAHSLLLESVRARETETALVLAEQAAAIDPGLHLYPLWIAYLQGDRAALENALALEPTWDVGWMRLAEIEERAGDRQAALAALDRIRRSSYASPAALHWARLAEELAAAPEEVIIDAYRQSMDWAGLPLSSFWGATPLRRAALQRYIDESDLDLGYRVAQVHFPEQLDAIHTRALASADAPAQWVRGEHALSVLGDAAAASAHFEQAIALLPSSGDYRASLARALAALGRPAEAEDALLIAELLGTTAEYPNAIRARMTPDLDARRRLWVRALPPQTQFHNFEGVLYVGRIADFHIPALYRFPGPGSRAMQPWYDLAQSYLDERDFDRAAAILRAIIDYAPDEIRAYPLLDQVRADEEGA